MFAEGYFDHYEGGPEGWAPAYEYRVVAAKIVDGDTVDLIVDVGFRQFMEDRFRLCDIDTWEKRRPTMALGRAAAARLKQLLYEAKAVRVVTQKDLHDRNKTGKFGRYIAALYVYIPTLGPGWINVADVLEAEGHAKESRDAT